MSLEKNMLHWHMHGDRFSPKQIQNLTGWQFAYQHEKDETIRFKNGQTALMDSGAAFLKVELDENVNWSERTDQFIAALEDNIELLRANGLEFLVFHVDVLYENQCNLEFEPSIIARIGRLGASLTVSAYKI